MPRSGFSRARSRSYATGVDYAWRLDIHRATLGYPSEANAARPGCRSDRRRSGARYVE